MLVATFSIAMGIMLQSLRAADGDAGRQVLALLRWHDALGDNATLVYAKSGRGRFDPPFRDHPMMTLSKEPSVYDYRFREQLTFRAQEVTRERVLESFQIVQGNPKMQLAPYSKISNRGNRIVDLLVPDADRPDQPALVNDRGKPAVNGDLARTMRLKRLAFGLGIAELFAEPPTLERSDEGIVLRGVGAFVPGEEVTVVARLDRNLLVRGITLTPRRPGHGVHYHLEHSGRKCLAGLAFPERCAVRVYVQTVGEHGPTGPISEDTQFEYTLRDFRRHLTDAEYEQLTSMERATKNAFRFDHDKKESYQLDDSGHRKLLPPYPSQDRQGWSSFAIWAVVAVHGVAFVTAALWIRRRIRTHRI
ncbi:MAG TPA: hypothetical protein PKC45_14750 [Gemmatales bacterium]|nr:hypothetical protein [Gemmatales bacterium]